MDRQGVEIDFLIYFSSSSLSGQQICYRALYMDYASIFKGINIQCYKMELGTFTEYP